MRQRPYRYVHFGLVIQVSSRTTLKWYHATCSEWTRLDPSHAIKRFFPTIRLLNKKLKGWDREMLADNCVPGGEVGHHWGLWDSLPLHLGALANVLTNSGSGYQFNVRKDRLHDESLHWKSQVQLHQTCSPIVCSPSNSPLYSLSWWKPSLSLRLWPCQNDSNGNPLSNELGESILGGSYKLLL